MIGVIADDFTGATDVAATLRKAGLRTLLFFGVPAAPQALPGHDALVVALKTRMLPPGEAVAHSLEALDWLRRNEIKQVYAKFCSTFDSTPLGNIGPVLDALADATRARTVLLTPSTPQHRRTQYNGYLFAGDVLLAESSMRDHPVTPMRDSYLPRLLRAQTDHEVGLIDWRTVRAGAEAVRRAVAEAAGVRYLLVDAIDDDDLRTVGAVAMDAPLVAGAAGLAGGLAATATAAPGEPDEPPHTGPAAVLSGSCSQRTLEQLAVLIDAGRPAFLLDVRAQPDPALLAEDALSWYDTLPAGPAPVFYSSMPPDRLGEVQRALGVRRSATILERAGSLIAAGLANRGVRRLIAAGGETSGAVVAALKITGGRIGPEAAPGVPWITPVDGREISLLLKSGNFGDADLLATASGDAP